jgi:hypothetical protein
LTFGPSERWIEDVGIKPCPNDASTCLGSA